jgi:hypothetical protein
MSQALKKFKAIQLSKLIDIKQKCSNQRVHEIVDLHLIPKLQHLRAADLADYIFTLYLASREYAVFEELIPSEEEVEELIKEKTELYYLKAKYIARLMRLRKELKSKYPEQADRIEMLVFAIAPKLVNARRSTLADYVFTVMQACSEFNELCSLIPSEEEIRKVLEK